VPLVFLDAAIRIATVIDEAGFAKPVNDRAIAQPQQISAGALPITIVGFLKANPAACVLDDACFRRDCRAGEAASTVNR